MVSNMASNKAKRRIVVIDTDHKNIRRLREEIEQLDFEIELMDFSSVELCRDAIFPPLRKRSPALPASSIGLVFFKSGVLQSVRGAGVEGVLGHPVETPEHVSHLLDLLLDPLEKDRLNSFLMRCFETGKVSSLLLECKTANDESTEIELVSDPPQISKGIDGASPDLATLTLNVLNSSLLSRPFEQSGENLHRKTTSAISSSGEFPGIDLFLVSVECLEEAPTEWVKKCKNLLAERRLLMAPSGSTRFILTSFGETKFDLKTLQNDFIEDLIFKPMDWPLVLQKIGLALSERREPPMEFLHTMKVNKPIDLAKETQIVQLSESSWIIRNPMPLIPGTIVKFHVPALFKDDPNSPVVGRCIKAEVSSEERGHLLHFSLIGLTPSRIKSLRLEVRRATSQKVVPKNRTKSDRSRLRNTSGVTDLKSKGSKILQPGKLNTLVVDFDSAVATRIQDYLQEFGESHTQWVSSMEAFHLLLQPISKSTKNEDTNVTMTADSRIDVLMVDAGLLPEDLGGWVEQLRLIFQNRRVNPSESRQVQLIVLGDLKAKRSPKEYVDAGFDDFIYKPFDRTTVLSKIEIGFSKNENAQLPRFLTYQPVNFAAFVSKEVQLQTLSEFGVVVRTDTKLRQHVFLRFFAPMLMDSLGRGIVAKCYKLKLDPSSETGEYLAHFSFFAVTDGFLRHIRSFIREEYAQEKAKAIS